MFEFCSVLIEISGMWIEFRSVWIEFDRISGKGGMGRIDGRNGVWESVGTFVRSMFDV